MQCLLRDGMFSISFLICPIETNVYRFVIIYYSHNTQHTLVLYVEILSAQKSVNYRRETHTPIRKYDGPIVIVDFWDTLRLVWFVSTIAEFALPYASGQRVRDNTQTVICCQSHFSRINWATDWNVSRLSAYYWWVASLQNKSRPKLIR